MLEQLRRLKKRVQKIFMVHNSRLKMLYTSDTIYHKLEDKNSKISIATVSDIFAESILRTYNHESISSLFDIDKG